MKFKYKNSGVCSRSVEFEIEGDVVRSVAFEGGCNGNTKGISALAEGMKVDELISRLSGIRCGFRPTSCPDQLARALIKAKQEL